ncbi:hypothetical protein BH10PSE1_BH10PSE1_28090 [soil metagenome]
MGGYSRNAKLNLGLIALIALRRAKAERAKRIGKDAKVEPLPAPKRKRGWFG